MNANRHNEPQYANTAPALPTPLPVPHQLDRLDKNIEALYATVNRLAERLEPVLMPEPGSKAGQDRPPTLNTVAGRTAAAASSIDEIGARLALLMDRLEI